MKLILPLILQVVAAAAQTTPSPTDVPGLDTNSLFRRDDVNVTAENTDSSRESSTSAKSTDDDSKTTSKHSSTSISIDPVLPAGGVNLQTPASTSTTYIKSGAKVTFGWNYTSLIATPSALNIDVTCTKNSQHYTLARNQSIKTSSIVWDTNEQDGNLHLISAEYTLLIYDAEGTPEDIGTAGKLAPFEYSFGVYIPQKYTPWPQAGKYMNISIKLGPPAILTAVLTVFTSLIVSLL